MASGVASLGRVVAYSSGRVAASPSLGRASIEALSGHVAASSFGRASAGSALASSAGRGPGGGVVGHRRHHRRLGGVGGRPTAAMGLGTAPLVRLPKLLCAPCRANAL